MVQLGKRRRVVIDDSDDEEFQVGSPPNTTSPAREIAVPGKKLNTPVKKFRDTPPEGAKFWVESTIPLLSQN